MSQTPGSPSDGLDEKTLAELRARFLAAIERGDPPIVLPVERFRWWEWPTVQWWWYRQFKRADRRAFKRECDQIRWRAAWRSDD